MSVEKNLQNVSVLITQKANWDGLNYDLCHTDWNAMLSCCEAEIGWMKFKTKLFDLCKNHIPTITIKSDFNPPWIDSEVYAFCRKKERLRSKFLKTRAGKYEV